MTELLNQAVNESAAWPGWYPVRPEANGLTVALQDLASGHGELFKCNAHFDAPKPVAVPDNSHHNSPLSNRPGSGHNALKHGHAARIEIPLTASQQRAVLTVEG